jgi:hypothetical protein
MAINPESLDANRSDDLGEDFDQGIAFLRHRKTGQWRRGANSLDKMSMLVQDVGGWLWRMQFIDVPLCFKGWSLFNVERRKYARLRRLLPSEAERERQSRRG